MTTPFPRMKKGWRLVARLGTSADHYPHLLVDAHGWCLRLGPVPRDHDKFYSRLETVFEGLVEHGVRQGFARREAALDPQGFLEELRDTLADVRNLARTAVREAVHPASIQPLDAPPPLREACGLASPPPARPTAFIAVSQKPA